MSGIERVDHDLVRRLIAAEGKATRRIERDTGGRCGQRLGVGRFAEMSVLADSQHDDVAGPAVGDEQVPAIRVQCQTAGERAFRRAPADQRQFASAIDGVCGDRAGGLAVELVDFIDRKQPAVGDVELERRGVVGGRSQTERHERHVLKDVGARRLEPERVNALSSVTVRADVDERVFRGVEPRRLRGGETG